MKKGSTISLETRKKFSAITKSRWKENPESFNHIGNKTLIDQTALLEFLEDRGIVDDEGQINFNPETCTQYAKRDLIHLVAKHFEVPIREALRALDTLDIFWHGIHHQTISIYNLAMYNAWYDYKESGGDLNLKQWKQEIWKKSYNK